MNFEGDPRLFFVDENGGDLIYENGQPKMDTALYNAINISLYSKDFWGNAVFEEQSQKIGSDYEKLTKELPITVENLRRMEDSAISACDWMIEESIADTVEADVRNPRVDRIEPTITITEPNGNVSPYSINWDNFAKESD